MVETTQQMQLLLANVSYTTHASRARRCVEVLENAYVTFGELWVV